MTFSLSNWFNEVPMKTKPSTAPWCAHCQMFNSRTPPGKTSGLIGETTAAEVRLERSDIPSADVRQTECNTGQRMFSSSQLPQSMKQGGNSSCLQKYKFWIALLTCSWNVPCRLECMFCTIHTDFSQSRIKQSLCALLLLEEKEKSRKISSEASLGVES